MFAGHAMSIRQNGLVVITAGSMQVLEGFSEAARLLATSWGLFRIWLEA